MFDFQMCIARTNTPRT